MRESRRATGLARQEKANEQAQLARKATAKDDALLFVTLAQNACRELARKTEALTADSIVDSSKMNTFVPAELYPTAPFAAYVSDGTLADVKSQLTQLVGSVVELLSSLERNQPRSVTRVDSQPDDAVKYRAAFKEKKLRALANTNMYCEFVRRAGAGLGTLR